MITAPAPVAPAPARGRRRASARRGLRSVPARIALGLVVPVVFVVFWHIGRELQLELPFGIRMGFLPYPGEVAVTLWDFAFGGVRDDAFSGTLWEHLGASVMRVLAGFGLAALIGVPLGVLMGRFYTVDALFDPFVNLLRPIPATAWVPLVALIIGIGDQATVFLITLSAFFPIVLGAASGTRQVPERLVEAARMLGTTRLDVLWRIMVPAAAPAIVNGLRVGLGLAWVVLVLGETTGVTTGLGATITLARDIVRTDLIVVGMICIGLAGFGSDRLLTLILRLVGGRRPVFA
ncbi:ABC transporter permease [Microbacterium sp.]|uniref:ABC transporter permease n=1 Tax=Microbacterium sp. TaxID=51671 RepID=UPI0028123A97|nr:ABC transporter permease [Microbacterium sp.]